MARIEGIDPRTAEPDLRRAFEEQVASWGDVLGPYRVYARRPTVFRAVRGMWDALAASGLLDGALKALVCRRVAAHNGCVF
jgi:alkylhydroperoxidase family enzyme